MPSVESAQELVCLACRRRITVTPKVTLLGFQALSCPSCSEEVVYPLTSGYRVSYQIATPIIMIATLVGLWIGKPLIPGLGFVVMAFALVRDRHIVRAVKDLSRPE